MGRMPKLFITCLFLFSTLLSHLVVSNAAVPMVLEAENGTLTGTMKSDSTSGYSGSGFVTNFDTDGDSVTVTTNITKPGLYALTIRYNAPYGKKHCNLVVNKIPAGEIILAATSGFTEISAGKVQLLSGVNTIKIEKGWGWYDIDFIKLKPASAPPEHKVTGTLVNTNATKEAKMLMKYLVSIYGKKILSGQQDTKSMDWLVKNTGKSPAVGGFDMTDYSPSRVSFGASSSETEKAIAWFKKGGIVTFCWHWNAPTDLINQPGKEWWSGFYTKATTFDLAEAVKPGSANYNLLLRDIDAIALQLKKLQTARVPVLWRPLHEASGGWFWWGAKGAKPCKNLYLLLFDRLTHYHKLNNLIWVWNSSEEDWYPGDQYVDIVSFDSYLQNGDYSPAMNAYEALVDLVKDRKIVTLSENGPIPDPDKLLSYRADWSWFCTWGGNFISDGIVNSAEHIKKVYNSPYVITLDELPGFMGATPLPNTPTPTPNHVTLSSSRDLMLVRGDRGNFATQDGAINMADIILMSKLIGSIPGDGLYAKDYDLNADKAINMADIMIVARHFSTAAASYQP